MSERLDIAIVGFGGVFPGAKSPEDFWGNIEGGKDASAEVPPERWYVDPDKAYAPGIADPDHVYSRRACLLDDFELERSEPATSTASRVGRIT